MADKERFHFQQASPTSLTSISVGKQSSAALRLGYEDTRPIARSDVFEREHIPWAMRGARDCKKRLRDETATSAHLVTFTRLHRPRDAVQSVRVQPHGHVPVLPGVQADIKGAAAGRPIGL